MPTASEHARAEGARWERLASDWADSPASEKSIVVFYDPHADLERRGLVWGHRFGDDSLSSLAMFAAGLCHAEADAWESDSPDVSTRAYEDRRFLLGDRIIHWAVPWLDAVGARQDRDFLLELGDEMKVAPLLPGREGLQASGEDSFGPVDKGPGVIESLWSGAVVLDPPPDPAGHYRTAASRWEALAAAHPGSAQLWTDLAARASDTAARFD